MLETRFQEKEDSQLKKIVRVIDGGGSGFRRADVVGNEVHNLKRIGPVQNIDQLLDFVCGDLLRGNSGIAYAMAGEIRDSNIVVKSPQIHLLDGVELGALTKARINKSVFVCSDMDGAVMGMAQLMPNLKYFAGITWSSGIGIRIFRNGEVLANGEGGHIPFDHSPFAPLCACGLRGCAESVIGGESIKRRVIFETRALGISIPQKMNPCTFLDISVRNGEKWALEIYNVIAKGMGCYLATIQMLFHLPAVVWKGTVAKHLLAPLGLKIREEMRQKLTNPYWEKEMEFFFSPRPEEDSLIGVAVLFWKKFLRS